MFDVGNKVEWVTYPAGVEKQLSGDIVEVLEAGERPSKTLYPSLWKKSEPGGGRSHESYVVLSENGNHYWPIVSRLKLVTQKTKKATKPTSVIEAVANKVSKPVGRVINYIGYSLDHSGSMAGSKARAAMSDFNSNLSTVRDKSFEYNQETYITVSQCGVYIGGQRDRNSSYGNRVSVDSVPVERVESLYTYDAVGNTPLYDSIMQLIDTMQSKHYHSANDDVSYLVTVITDGEENASVTSAYQLKNRIVELQNSGNWTFTFRVPRGSQSRVSQLGVPADNILTWDGQTSESLLKASSFNNTATESFYMARAAGKTQTTAFYANLNASDSTIKATLTDITAQVWLWPITETIEIRPFVLQHINSYTKGKAFYQLTKPEDVQDYKQIIIQDKRDGKIYGGDDAKSLLGLPVNQVGTIRLRPGDSGNYDIFVESTSINRKLLPNTRLLYLK